jgi:hypothetical protein
LDNLSITVDTANKNTTYLKALNGNIFTSFATKAPKDSAKVLNVQFATDSPKDSHGRPIPTPRITSLTMAEIKKSKRQVDANEKIEIVLDESANVDQKERSEIAEKLIDRNLNYVRQGVKNLKHAAETLSTELDRQNQVVTRINDKADANAAKVDRLNSNIRGNSM